MHSRCLLSGLELFTRAWFRWSLLVRGFCRESKWLACIILGRNPLVSLNNVVYFFLQIHRYWNVHTWETFLGEEESQLLIQNRIIESFRLEKTFKIIESNHHACPLNHVLEYLVYVLFEYLQGWWLNHFPGQPIPMSDNPLSKKIFPNIQPKSPLPQLEAISSCPISSHLSSRPAPTSLQSPFR